MENTTEPNKSTDASPVDTTETTPNPASSGTVISPSTNSTAETFLSSSEPKATLVETTPAEATPAVSTSPMAEIASNPATETTAQVPPSAADSTPPPTASGSEPPIVHMPTPTSSPQHDRPKFKMALFMIVGLVLLGGVAMGSYLIGKHRAKPATTPMTQTAAMTVPAGATIIEKCEPGLGTQYVLPKDIPGGPVYNVYQGKVIGIEYMTSITTVDKLDTMLENLPLYNQKYDHINVMSMPAHSGYPTPHYQVDVMMVPAATAKKITCGNSSSMSGSSSSNSSSNMSNGTMSSNSTSKM